MIRDVFSPVARAASTKSRLRSDSVWARSTRAPQAQPVTEMTRMIPIEPLWGRYAARMIVSGRLGRTRNTFASRESTSSLIPPR